MNAEIIKVARKAATHFRRTDGYGQAAEIITMLCDELEKTQQPNDTPRTVASVLLERWAKDTEAMVEDTKDIHYNVIMERWEFPNGTVALCESDAERLYRAYLNSAAEGATK